MPLIFPLRKREIPLPRDFLDTIERRLRRTAIAMGIESEEQGKALHAVDDVGFEFEVLVRTRDLDFIHSMDTIALELVEWWASTLEPRLYHLWEIRRKMKSSEERSEGLEV